MKKYLALVIAFALISTPVYAATTTTVKTKKVAPVVLVPQAPVSQPTTASKVQDTAKTLLARIVGFLEPFRVKEAIYFATLRDEVKTRIGIAVSSQVGVLVQEKVKQAFTPDIPAAPLDPAAAADVKDVQSDNQESAPIPGFSLDNPMDYITLLYSTSLATLFASKALFYISVVLLTLIVLRFIIRRFFSASA